MDINVNYMGLDNVMPASREAEQAVLGSILIEPAHMDTVAGRLTPDHFYYPEHRAIYTAALNKFNIGEKIDLVTMTDACQDMGLFDSRDQLRSYMYSLAELVPTMSNLEAYIKIVEERFTERSVMAVAQDILDTAKRGEESAGILLDKAEQNLTDIRRGSEKSGPQKIASVVAESLIHLQELDKQSGKPSGLPTGYGNLDRYIFGLNPSDFVLLAARPAMGKTAFALNMAVNVSRRTDKNVVIFSLEMSAEQVVNRMLSSEALVDNGIFRTGGATNDQWHRIMDAADYLAERHIYIDDSPMITIPEMKSRLRRIGNLGLVVVDHLQLMTTGRHSDNRVAEVTELSRNLKLMAKELNVPVLCLAQLNRDLEKREDKRPKLSDLRESGSIEQDADVVLMLHRDAYHNKESENANVAECIITKNRHGELSTVQLGWDGAHTLFTNLEVYRNDPQGQ